ncbi:GreA/GreB family elongation factor, partial [Candidatus Parcubacteria bacterium]|nr:GreA/GreB family elongation factor [Candidatus Parcubacteria bacterium]
PLGMAFINRKVGDIVRVETPGGESEYKILNIE